MRLHRILKLLTMEGSVWERIGTGVVIVVGFLVGLHVGRFLLNIF